MTFVRIARGEAQSARALGEDTPRRCRRVFGPDHPIALWAVRV